MNFLILSLSISTALILATLTQSQTPREGDSSPALIRINEKNYTLPLPGPHFIQRIDIDDAEVQEASLLNAPATMLAYLWSDEGFLSPSISVARPLPRSHPGLSTRLFYADFAPGRYATLFQFESGVKQIYYLTSKSRTRRTFIDGPQTVQKAAVLTDPEDSLVCDVLDGSGSRTGIYIFPALPRLVYQANLTGFVCSDNIETEYPWIDPRLFH